MFLLSQAPVKAAAPLFLTPDGKATILTFPDSDWLVQNLNENLQYWFSPNSKFKISASGMCLYCAPRSLRLSP